MARSSRSTGAPVRLIFILIVLLLLLLGLASAYYYLTRPAEIEGEGEQDRNFLFSIYGFEGDLLRRPSGVGFDPQGNIYVADTGKRRIVVFDSDGDFLRVFGEAGKEPLKLWDPIDVAVAPDGRSFVVDKTQSKIVEFDVTGRAARDISVEEAPLSVTIANDLLFATTESGVLIADLKGDLQTGYIKRGKEPGEFDRPGGVAVDEAGTLYVADSLNYRVQAISSSGEPLWQYGTPLPPDRAVQYDSANRKFGLPSNITIDGNDLLYVVDGLNSEIVVMSTEGERLETIGDVGHADGAFYYPDGIDYADGRIAVADKFNDRVSVFSTPLPPGQQWRAYVPYGLALLLLLPLLLLPLLLRRRKYIVTAPFVELLAADEDRDVLAKALRRVYAVPTVATLGTEHPEIDLKWIARQPKQEDVDALTERFLLAPEHAEVLAVALSLRGKRAVIAENESLKPIADELGIAFLAYGELKEALEAGQGAAEALAETEEVDGPGSEDTGAHSSGEQD